MDLGLITYNGWYAIKPNQLILYHIQCFYAMFHGSFDISLFPIDAFSVFYVSLFLSHTLSHLRESIIHTLGILDKENDSSPFEIRLSENFDVKVSEIIPMI